MPGSSTTGRSRGATSGIIPKALQDLEGFYDLAANSGVLIDSVEGRARRPRKPASGPGDIILSINGRKVDGRFPEQLPPIQNLIASQPVGSSLVLDYKRGSKEGTATLVTTKLESRMGEEWVSDTWGIGVRKVSRAYARENQLADDTGVLVIGVQRGFPAEVAGIARGDIITKINQSPVASLDVVKATDAAYAARPAPTLFEVQRERRVELVVAEAARKFPTLFLAAAACACAARAADLPTLMAERVKCTVAVEYVTQTELERRPTVAYGTVVDNEGTIILPSAAIDLRISPKQIRDFKVYIPGDPDGTPAEYLGRDAFTGWHFVRASASIRSRLVPVTSFSGAGPARDASLADEVWGIGIRNKDEDFTPYILRSSVALIQLLPQRTAIAQQEVAGPGLPVFDRDGRFVGIGSSSFGQTFLEFTGADRDGSPIMLVNLEESSAFLVASEVIPNIGRIPKNLFGRPLAWLGAYGLEPMDREVASFLKLESQSGAVVSEVLEGSPGEKAGLKAHDIILGVDGKPLPKCSGPTARPGRRLRRAPHRGQGPGRHHDVLHSPGIRPGRAQGGARGGAAAGARGRPDVL